MQNTPDFMKEPSATKQALLRAKRHFAGKRIVFLCGEPSTRGEVVRISNLVDALQNEGFNINVINRNNYFEYPEITKHCDVLWIWRLLHEPRLDDFIYDTRAGGAKIVFDIDDLLLDKSNAIPEYLEDILSGYPAENFMDACERFKTVLKASDYASAPTTALLNEMKKYSGHDGSVVPNGFSRECYKTAQTASELGKPNDGFIRIGYATGTHTHQQDFSVCYDGLCNVLEKHPNVKFVCYSDTFETNEFPRLAALKSQIELRELVPMEKLPYESARYDIALAPLRVGNLFCECKSELKYIDAAIVKVPCVAAPTQPFASAIKNGVNGFLATTPEEWEDCLTKLVEDEELRQKMGMAAYNDCIARYNPICTRDRMLDIFKKLGVIK